VAAIDDVAQKLRTLLDGVNSESEKLKRALSGLGDASSARSGRPSGRRKPGPKPGPRGAFAKAAKPSPRNASATRVPRAERERAILTFLKGSPKASAKEIAAAVGTTANYVNNMLTGLRKQGRLVRQPDGSQVEVKVAASGSARKSSAAKPTSRRKPGRPKGSGNKPGRKRGSKKRGAKKAAAKAETGK
jgi:hypothetical protein